jgi:hypothetical protein
LENIYNASAAPHAARVSFKDEALVRKVEKTSKSIKHIVGGSMQPPLCVFCCARENGTERRNLTTSFAWEEAGMADVAVTELVERMRQAGAGEITMAEALHFDDKRMLEIAKMSSELIKACQFDDAIVLFRGLVALDPRVPFFHQGLV